MTRVRPVVLSGGSGTRLWPLSVDTRPKQFLRLFGGQSLFEATVERSRSLPGASGPIVVTGASHVPLVEEAAKGAKPTILIEPGPRNTGPAIVAAALIADPADILVVLPSDHLIPDNAAFVEAAKHAIELAEDGGVVAFGCVPDRAEVGYGWIRPGAPTGPGYEIAEFVEKPDAGRAGQMLESGYLWNSGMFVAMASVVVDEATTPGLREAVERSVADRQGGLLAETFLDSPSISFDHAVMERTGRGRVVPLDAGWSDIGSWQAVWEKSAKDLSGNAVEGQAHLIDVKNSLIRSTSRPVAVVGLDDVVVVETADGVIVVPRGRSQEVRDVGLRFQGDDSKS